MCQPFQIPPSPPDDPKKIAQRGVLWLGVGPERRGDRAAPEDQCQAGARPSDTASPRLTHPRPLAPSQPSPPCPAHLGGPGGATRHQSRGPLFQRPRPWQRSAWRLGREGRASQGRPRLISMDCTPWRRSGGMFWLINHESGHGSCPLLWANGSRGLVTEEELVFPCSDSPASVTTVARKSASPGRGAPHPCPWAPGPREGLMAALEGCDTSRTVPPTSQEIFLGSNSRGNPECQALGPPRAASGQLFTRPRGDGHRWDPHLVEEEGKAGSS